MAIRHDPDHTYRLDTPGYSQLPFQKIYSHPRRRQNIKNAVTRAYELGLVLASLDEMAALRCAANGQYAADQPQLTRTALWQWRDHNATYLALENNASFDHNTVMTEAAHFHGQGHLRFKAYLANRLNRAKARVERLRAIEQPYESREVKLDELAKDAFARVALKSALDPYAKYLRANGHETLEITLPRIDPQDQCVLIYHLVLGQDNKLFSDERMGFCQGIKQARVAPWRVAKPQPDYSKRQPKAL